MYAVVQYVYKQFDSCFVCMFYNNYGSHAIAHGLFMLRFDCWSKSQTYHQVALSLIW